MLLTPRSFICLLATTFATSGLAHSRVKGISKTINNNGVNIHYVTYGSGEALVLQHGFPDRESTWNTFQVNEFAEQFKVITPTLRGWPPSDIPSGPSNYSLEIMVSDLAAILENEGINRTVLVGHDLGGSVVQSFAYAFPQRVRALVMTNTPVLPTWLPLVEFDPEQQKMSEYTLKYFGYVAGQPKNVSTLVEHIQNNTYRREISDYLERSDISGMLNMYKANYPAPPYRREVNLDGMKYRVPSCIIWGDLEPYFSARTLDGLAKWFSNGVRLVTIPDAGHWSFRDQPKRWNAELWSFLELLEDYKFPLQSS